MLVNLRFVTGDGNENSDRTGHDGEENVGKAARDGAELGESCGLPQICVESFSINKVDFCLV
jgi:hypothetical protein